MDERLNAGASEFHLVIPCFEESRRLPFYLDELLTLLEARVYRTTILIVDDGSGRQEQARLQEALATLKIARRVVLESLYLEKNMGKGYAVRRGWQGGDTARWLAFADADGATPAHEVVRIFDAVHRDNDLQRCYLGSRVRMLGRSVERSWKRHIVGRIYATLVGLVIGESVYDSQCGFKIIPAQAFAAISGVLQDNRFAFDSELIAALSEAGYQLEEVPIDWKDIPGSKVSLIKDSVRMLRSLLVTRSRKKRGLYRINSGRPHKGRHGSTRASVD